MRNYSELSSRNEFSKLDLTVIFISDQIKRKLSYRDCLKLWITSSYSYHWFIFTKKYRMRKSRVRFLFDRDCRIFRKRMRTIYNNNPEFYPMDSDSVNILNKYLNNDNKFIDIESDNNIEYLFEHDETNYLKRFSDIKLCTRSKDLIKNTYGRLILELQQRML